MTMVSDRLTDEQLAEILSGSVDGMEPTTQELAMATELQELRKQNELQRGELLKAHITLLNQQKQLQKYRNADSTEPVAMRWRWKDAELRNTGEWWYHDARYFAELSVDDSRECELMYSSPQSISGYPETLPCPVHLVPGLRFGKGCKTEGLLIALQRRAEYYAELDAMTPEERAEHDANIAAFKTMLPQPVPEGLNPEIVSLPDDWQLVPKKPNGPMLTAGYQAYMKGQHRGRFYRSYQAMLEAAPKLSEVNK
ncbi:hypothetical protein ACFWS8_002081 [Salmonella enterica]|uniref:hypothetical protein n=1 Tax=Salmonella enterica TaxID=28901 RepID=UPI0020CB0DED|nr:hypothetical protein [Salmonella enterica]